jgi:dolichyldiphosphatase
VLCNVKLTVNQDPHDTLSLFCAYLALLPQALCVVYATLTLTTREAEIALTFAGQLACEALNFCLKRLIKEERPARIHGKGYGMPSSHAQFVAFWSVYVALFLLRRYTPPKVMGYRSSTHRPWSLGERVGVVLVGFGMAGLTAWSRVYLGYHSPRQVVWGSTAGAVIAVAWYVVVGVVRDTALWGWALEHPLSRRMRVRDLIIEEDMCQAGWEKWEDRREAKMKGKTR